MLDNFIATLKMAISETNSSRYIPSLSGNSFIVLRFVYQKIAARTNSLAPIQNGGRLNDQNFLLFYFRKTINKVKKLGKLQFNISRYRDCQKCVKYV